MDELMSWARMKIKPSKSRNLSIRRGVRNDSSTFVVGGEKIPLLVEQPIKSLGRQYTAELSDKQMGCLNRAPDIMVIHINWTHWYAPVSRKLSGTLTFPRTGLTLPTVEGDVVYDLYATIEHWIYIRIVKNKKEEANHYIAFCQNQLDSSWTKFDDSRVDSVNTDMVSSHHCTQEADKNGTVEVLFYKKRHKVNASQLENAIVREIFTTDWRETNSCPCSDSPKTSERREWYIQLTVPFVQDYTTKLRLNLNKMLR
ncbi:ubiquitin carboxyl-terminal hydrolase 31-like isoform X2 [Corythoichthys intestinalis]|uniref:ubiquitin carboxyl-terminal hydrolase 31-like isoform X2 n=1 Tax=Corythoichthys intestinalis TaxID=161448 RepID=UPI0025A60C49|nr:ubiquitin carboxyl-terminal hydrolase 31-like isoform X2 [Corythoichthys intestinalis]